MNKKGIFIDILIEVILFACGLFNIHHYFIDYHNMSLALALLCFSIGGMRAITIWKEYNE